MSAPACPSKALPIKARASAPSCRSTMPTSAEPPTRVLIVDDHGVVREGLRAYLELEPDIQVVGEAKLHPEVARRLMQQVTSPRKPDAGAQLTDREREVLRLLADGRSNKEIARSLVVSERTVKGHVSNILGKLGLQDRTQAALFAVRNGLSQDQ